MDITYKQGNNKLKYFNTQIAVSLISCMAIFLSSLVYAEKIELPDSIKNDFTQLDDPAKIEMWRKKRIALSDDQQQLLIAYFKGLDLKKNKDELHQAIKLIPYLASKLSFKNYSDLLKYSILEKYYTPDAVKYGFLQEVGYMVIAEKSKSSKAYKLLLELRRMPDNKRFKYSRTYGFSGMVFIRISSFLRLFDNLLPDIDKNKKDQAMLLAGMENQLGNNPKKLFILNNKTAEPIDDTITHDKHGIPVMKKVVYSYDSKKHDRCRTNNNEYFKMLVDVLSYPDPKVKMAAAKELRRYTKQNFDFNPVGTEVEQRMARKKWQKYISEHDVLKERKAALLKRFKEAKAREKLAKEKKAN